MSFLEIVFFIIKWAPEILPLVEDLLKAIHGMAPTEQARVGGVMSGAMLSNDKQTIIDLHENLCKGGTGVGCPASLKN